MIKENKVSKYMLYAIGEIVLVVIGILIALEINDRSAQRKLEQTNIMMMARMQGELQININRLHYMDTGYVHEGIPLGFTPVLERIDTALFFVSGNLDKAQIDWLLKADISSYGSLYNMSNSVYHEMLNSGRFYSLGTDSLINRIQLHYQLLDREERYADDSNKDAAARWAECKYGFLDLKNEYARNEAAAIAFHPWVYEPRSEEYLNLKAALIESRRTTERNRRHAHRMIKDAKSLIESLEIEMNSMQ